MRRLRFCHLTTFYPPHSFGGDAIGVQRLARGLASRGHDVTVVCDVDAFNVCHHGPEPPAEASTDGVRVIRLRTPVGPLAPLLTHQLGRPLINGRRIARLLAADAFDVIHFHNVSLIGGPGLLRYGAGIKLYTAHEHWLVCPTHVLWRRNREPCSGRQCLRCVLAHHRPPQLWRHAGSMVRAVRHVDAFLAMSEFSAIKHAEFGFPRRMEVLPYFLPDEDTVSSLPAADSPHSRPYFLFVGRLETIKGLHTLIPVFREYQGADLLVVGDGTQEARLRELASGIPRVRFVGRVPTEELARFYRNALALIVPSVGFETFGIVIIEAFRHGTPVIARRIGPFPEIVDLAQGGALFSDSEALMAAMRRLQEDPTHRAALGRNAHDAYRRHWSEGAVIPRYLEIVRRIAAERGLPHVVEALAPGSTAATVRSVS